MHIRFLLFLSALLLLSVPHAGPVGAATTRSPHWTACTIHYSWPDAKYIVRKVCVKHPMPRLRNHRPSWGHVLISDRLVSPHVRVRVWFPRTYQPRPPEGYRIFVFTTGYSWGCGTPNGVTASGTIPHVGTVASNSLPFGTRIYVPSLGYSGVVEDRGAPMDLFMSSCAATYAVTGYREVIVS